MKKATSAYILALAMGVSLSVLAEGNQDGFGPSHDQAGSLSLSPTATAIAIGGSIRNTELKNVRCKNLRTGKSTLIKLPEGSASWECAAPGFKVRPGDRVTAILTGQIPVVDTPVQVSPLNESIFDYSPRTTTLKWENVSNADSYTVEIDCFQCCVANQWCTDVGEVWSVVPNIKTTEYTFDFVGAQPGRWRVWAVDSDGQQSAKTDWWDFIFLR